MRELQSARFPWYDSVWLADYAQAKDTIRRVRPGALDDFENMIRPLRTRPDFEVVPVARVFDAATRAAITQAGRTVSREQLALNEVGAFGRLVVRNQPLFNELQQTLVPLVSELAGEPVEASYNFLSLYSRMGVCRPHMDSPEAKWTLDVCIDQSDPWPIYFSQVVPWPEQLADPGEGWEQQIRTDPALRFQAFTLEPGDAVMFSGSSQWHYRDPMPGTSAGRFCDLLFFHFIPRGLGDVVDPRHWAAKLGIPELSA